MNLRIYATGQGFGETSDFKSVIELIGNYEEAFDRCLKRSCLSNNVSSTTVHLRLSAVYTGSLDVSLITDIASAVAPLAPQIFGYAWQLYKSAYDLVMLATQRFNEKGKPMNINIMDSPGAIVNIVNGNQVNTTNDVLEIARAIHPYLNKIALLIKNKKADRIELDNQTEDDGLVKINFNGSNQDSFKLPEQDTYDEAPVELECEIYRFNKKSLNGYLEFQDQDESQVRPFSISHELLDTCIESIKSPSAKITAYREMSKNALGETKIKKFHIVSISQMEN